MARYKDSDTSQGLFLTVNLQEQLLLGTFEWTVNYLVDKIDISVFAENYHNDELGAAAYSPRTLLKIILYCYSKGILSSRKIEAACKNNVVLKALAEDKEPDHATIAHFVSSNEKAVKDIFIQILLQCQELELIQGEMFAVDGCKLPSNASKQWSGKIGDLKKKQKDVKRHLEKILERHKELDSDEEAVKKLSQYKATLGNESERRKRRIERIEKKLQKLNKFLETAEPKTGISGEEVQTNITDPESAKIKGAHGYIQGYNGIAIADSKTQVIISSKAIGSGAESGCFPEMLDELKEHMQTITGKESPLEESMVLGDTGYFSEDNLQEAETKEIEVIIPDPQFRKRDTSFEGRKHHPPRKKYTVEDFVYNEEEDSYTCPAGKVLNYKCRVKLRNNEGKQYRASSVDCNACPQIEKCMVRKAAKKPGRTLYIVDRKDEINLSEEMKKKIDTPVYRELYSRRIQIIEPVFANITYCKGMNRFTLRTQKKVNIQWVLYTIVHNIGKCMQPLALRYGG